VKYIVCIEVQSSQIKSNHFSNVSQTESTIECWSSFGDTIKCEQMSIHLINEQNK